MDRSNFFHGQTVLESELDQVFDDAENAERNLALEAGICQALTTDSPSSDVYGGIVKGLVVSGAPGDTEVAVAIGQALDNQGRRINFGTAGTVAVSNAGTTPEGDYTSALGNGAAISGSCPAGQRVVASLFIVYDEHLSDARTDATGSTIQYRIAESFHFDIQIGVAFAHPPAGTPGRAALANNKVLLTDLLLTNNGGTMELVAILNTDAQWDALTGNYANCAGRRSDCIAFDQGTFEKLNKLDTSIRSANPRDGLYDLLDLLQTAVIWRVGGGTISPVAGQYGLTMGSEDLDASKGLLRIYSQVAGTQRQHEVIASKYGIPAKPHVFYDPMIYHYGDLVPPATITRPQNLGPWGVLGINGNVWHRVYPISSQPGGVMNINTNAVGVNDGVVVTGQAYIDGGFGDTYTPAFNLGAAPWIVAYFRFRFTTVATGIQFGLGFVKDGGWPPLQYAIATFDGSVSATNLNAALESTGGMGVPVLIGTIVEDTWYTLRMAVLTNTTMMFQLNDGTPVSASVAGGAVITSGGYCPFMYAINKAAAVSELQIDEVYVAAGELGSDMRL